MTGIDRFGDKERRKQRRRLRTERDKKKVKPRFYDFEHWQDYTVDDIQDV